MGLYETVHEIGEEVRKAWSEVDSINTDDAEQTERKLEIVQLRLEKILKELI